MDKNSVRSELKAYSLRIIETVHGQTCDVTGGGATPRPSGVANSSCKVLGPSIYQQVPQWKSTYLHAHLQDSTALENNIGEREISAYFWFYRACDSCHAPAFIMKCL